MRAALVTGPGDVEVTDVDDPTPGPDDVVVAVAACGICGTDLHIIDDARARPLPLIPGHEFSGEVVALGANVTEFRIGDSVAVDPNLHCGACHWCRRGRGNLCERYAALGVTTDGAAAEYAVAPVRNCVRLPAGVDVADAALIEPLSCAVRAFDVLRTRLGDHVLIYGAGTMGLINLTLAKRVGATAVDVVDRNAARLDGARALGARSVATDAAELDAPRGWDVVIDCTGAIAAIEDGLTRVARGGTFLQFGVTDEHALARWSPFRVYRDEITIIGSMAVLNSFERAADLFASGALTTEAIVSDRFPLEQYPEAVARFRTGAGRKIHVVPAAR